MCKPQNGSSSSQVMVMMTVNTAQGLLACASTRCIGDRPQRQPEEYKDREPKQKGFVCLQGCRSQALQGTGDEP